MRALIFTLLLSASSSALAQEFYLVFEQASFLDGYRESTYINGLRAVNVRQENMHRAAQTAAGMIPAWKTVTLSNVQLTDYLEKILELGVADWRPQYPESTEGLICDGYSFMLAIEGRGLSLRITGSCDTPDEIETFREITAQLFSLEL